jgi:hypothetical protein
LGKADTALQSYTETDPTVPSWAKASNKPTYSKSEVGLGNVENVKQYSASNPPPYPVTSVNGKTGVVSLTASDVKALPDTTVIPTIPTSLKNPNALTINGTSYDGSEAIDATNTINSMIDAKAKSGENIHHIVDSSSTVGVWTGTCSDFADYYNGLTILYRPSVDSGVNGTILDINNCGSCEVMQSWSNTPINCPAGSMLMLTFLNGIWLTVGSGASTSEIEALIDNKLGVIENGSY